MAKFHCLIVFTSRNVEQFVYYDCFLTRLWSHKIWNYHYLSYQAVLLHGQIVKTKTQISWEWKELLRWNKKHFFIIFKGLSFVKNCLRPENASLQQRTIIKWQQGITSDTKTSKREKEFKWKTCRQNSRRDTFITFIKRATSESSGFNNKKCQMYSPKTVTILVTSEIARWKYV